MRSSGAETGEEGFTILELIVCLGLLTLITTWALEGVSLVKRGAAVINRVEVEESERAVQMHLRRALERAVPVFAIGEAEEATLVFNGEPARLRLVTRSDGRLENGGLILAEFRTETLGETRALITERQPMAGMGSAGTPPEQHTLLHPIDGVAFRYFGMAEGGSGLAWASEWKNPSALPLLIEVKVDFAKLGAKTWIIAIAAANISAAR